MKLQNNKPAFTLAEVLVTLAVIGVVASLTIPPIVKNTQDAQLKAAFKNNFSTASQAVRAIAADNNGTLKGSLALLQPDNIVSGWSPYFKHVKTCQYQSGCWHAANDWKELDGDLINSTRDVGFITPNGALLTFSMSNTQCANFSYGTIQGKGICGYIVIDVNGFKQPNTLGKDIYHMWVQEDRISPRGSQGDLYVNYCQPGVSQTNAGYGCAAKVLQNIDY